MPVILKSDNNVNRPWVANDGVGGVLAAHSPMVATMDSPIRIIDAAASARTTSFTVSPTVIETGSSMVLNVNVSAVSGTNPTMDVRIEMSDDGGANWMRIWDVPRVTTTGVTRSAPLLFVGTLVRYSVTLGGTSPSFTVAFSRTMIASQIIPPIVQMIDRTIVPDTLNSTTASIRVGDYSNRIQAVVTMGAITTTAPAFQVEGSTDSGANWFSIGTPITGVANTAIQVTVTDTTCQLLRARVSTAGVGATLGSILLKAHD